MEQVQFLPGSGGDVVKAVQNLPGVNRAPLGTGQVLIRGTAPEDSATTLDGMPLPIVFHFGGLNTVVTSEVLEEVAFLPGNTSVRYGRILAGIVDLRTDPSIPEESRGTLSVDLFQASAFIEQRLSNRTAVALSARRSYIDTVLSPVLSNATGTRFQAPRYSDVNARLLHRTPRGDVVDAFFVGSSDAFRVIGTDESTGEDETTIGLQTRFAKLRLLVRHVDDSGIRHETTLIAGPEEQAFQVAPDGDAFERPLDLAVRHELFRAPPGDPRDGSFGVGWRAGLDVQARRYRFLYDVPSFGVREEGDIGILAPAAYVEPTVRLSRWDLVVGLRADMFTTDTGYTETSTDPRLSVRYHPGSSTRLKMSAGRFSRFPEPREVTPSADGNPDLTEEVAWQTSVGVEQDIAEAWRVEVNAYDNHLQDLVSGNEDAFRFFSGPPPAGPLDTGPYANDGTGRSTGAELLVRFQADSTFALLSATVSRSVRRKRPDSDLVLFEYDQPVIVNALVSRDLPRNWKIGGRFRYGSGNPITPVVNRWFDADTGDWQPVYGAEQERTPAFWQLDLRVDKSWEFRTWTLSTFLDLQNATNHNNVEVVGTSDDYYTEEPVNGLPILPVFGVKGAW
ncbi:MAG: TonB-dependent receptor [Deltaproteobacteria bacterium]|nr:MAG: TonB-dependent receptor [Deltaproteobacteria bacterium]